ncbi:MAG: hypothetical protein MZW92_81650, partial [Comamonadaceae bacterium]|nr:hypothetical protein [Comamonadaceae bacterium]
MTVERYIRLMAGFFILLSLALGVEASPIFAQPLVAGRHRLRRLQPVPVRHHQLLPAELPAEEAGRARA